MCGRFVRETPLSVIGEEFDVRGVPVGLKLNYNIAPDDSPDNIRPAPG
jgi:hypothetical protein